MGTSANNVDCLVNDIKLGNLIQDVSRKELDLGSFREAYLPTAGFGQY